MLHILAIGKINRDGAAELCAEYEKRLKAKISITEIDIKEREPKKLRERESAALLDKIPPDSFVVVLDGTGKELSSLHFAEKMQQWGTEHRHITFLIGGADGHTPAVLKKADFILSFGTMTWPHRLARVMLLEQLYRAQQIAAGHPYHRE